MADQPPKQIGRPKAPEPGSAVTVWMRQSEHDRLVKLAKEQDRSVSACARELLTRRLRAFPY